MEEKLVRALESTGLSVYALERPETIKNCLVYKYSESNESYSDDEADIESYKIYINLYCESGFNKYKNLIKQSMKSEGFGMEYIAPAHKSKELGVIQQSFTFIYVQKNI
ncbi:hypothetical protein PMY35_07550 [Clostridium tertium]|uniref:hypothetical protein n=1 Tax=Clostridium tertium TaxID=1559 RepID=UPI0018A05E36|nr:hypothetical protein [Clostridium tertium]MDB1947673.1 hypothetical protein [Clostridium tertium]